ncbi:ataxin-10-like [Toxorhynchites rutilus septentrionalis]|uniref:ataxin-10-like n=1 Tax=Toxorhynchites rutilus septentrionalis TaxID=329112 RepID=UPI00247916D6|nr:ataxin-10-like [Toxorhynchites rutilus septentrionalis]
MESCNKTEMEEISKQITDHDYEAAVNALNVLDISSNFFTKSKGIFRSFLICYESKDDEQNKVALKCLNILKRSCALGQSYQNEIIAMELFLSKIKSILDNEEVHENVRTSCLQLLANLCVQNKPNQELVLNEFKEFLLESIKSNTILTNAATMILYNSFIYKSSIGLNAQELLEVLLSNVEINRLCQKETTEFVSIFLEYLMCESNEIVDGYERINYTSRINFLRYVSEYLRQQGPRDRPLQPDLFKHLLVDFKKKSDCVLKNVDSYLDQESTEEVFTLLMLFSDATCVEPYDSFLRADSALFLNMGCLLRQLQSRGKNCDANIFTPVEKIEEILKVKEGTSNLNIEQDISFSLKSSLVKGLANLAYRNKKNQNLAREMGIIAAILECTNLDARNPLIKEWSILAIRNLCDDNLENQKFIASITKVGDAENSLVTDFTSGGGTIRISDGSSTSKTK